MHGVTGMVEQKWSLYINFSFACSSKEWTNVPDREKRKMGLVVADDGEFW